MFCQILRHNLRGVNVEYLNLNNFIVKAYVYDDWHSLNEIIHR